MCWQPESSVWPSSCFFFSFASLGGILKTRYHLTMSCTACPSAYHSVHSILCNLFWGSMLHLSRQSRCSVLPPTCCLPKLFFFSFFSASSLFLLLFLLCFCYCPTPTLFHPTWVPNLMAFPGPSFICF